MQLIFESSVFEYLEDFGMGIFDAVFGAVWYWFVKYGIAVNIEDNKEAIVAADAWYDE